MSDETPESPSCPEQATVTQRVKEIRDLMLSGDWKTGNTSYVLAQRWGISEYTVRKHANEASRQIESAFDDRSEIRAKVFLLLETAIECAAEARATAPEKAAKVLVDVGRQFARMAGIEAPQKIAITDSKGDDIPPAIAAALSDPVIARLYLALNRMPSDAEVEAERAKSSGLSSALVLYPAG